MLFQVKKLTFVCTLESEANRGAQYCLSPGTKSKVWQIDKIKCVALIQLPSKDRKLFPLSSCALIGRVSLKEKKRYFNTKSGY
jgi:ribosomal protein L2